MKRLIMCWPVLVNLSLRVWLRLTPAAASWRTMCDWLLAEAWWSRERPCSSRTCRWDAGFLRISEWNAAHSPLSAADFSPKATFWYHVTNTFLMFKYRVCKWRYSETNWLSFITLHFIAFVQPNVFLNCSCSSMSVKGSLFSLRVLMEAVKAPHHWTMFCWG